MSGLITFEGVDGCGKSTQLKLAASWLQELGEQVVTTYEPGDTGLGAELRRLLLSGEYLPVPEAELLLFLADRAQHVREVIQPALADGAWVLCDRYSDSTLAYQLAARKLGEQADDLGAMLTFAECGVKPDLTLWFDLSVPEAMARMQKRAAAGEKATRLDAEAASFHERVSEAFTGHYRDDTGRIRRIDAGMDIDAVAEQVRFTLSTRFPALSQ